MTIHVRPLQPVTLRQAAEFNGRVLSIHSMNITDPPATTYGLIEFTDEDDAADFLLTFGGEVVK